MFELKNLVKVTMQQGYIWIYHLQAKCKQWIMAGYSGWPECCGYNIERREQLLRDMSLCRNCGLWSHSLFSMPLCAAFDETDYSKRLSCCIFCTCDYNIHTVSTCC